MNTRRPKSASRGFTLVELLVVIAILAIIILLLLPAINAVRETARKITCTNQIRQIGLGVINFENANGRFPPGQRRYSSGGQEYAWSVFMLDMVEQKAVLEGIDFDQDLDSALNKGTDDNRGAVMTAISLYLCPSAYRVHPTRDPDGRVGDLDGDGRRNDPRRDDGFGCIDYLGITGPHHNARDPGGAKYNRNRGILLSLKDLPDTLLEPPRVRVRDITDGLSKSIMVGECSGRGADNGMWASGSNVSSLEHQINLAPETAWEEEDLFSDHPGGAHALFADGAVIFLPDATDLAVLQALASRNGAEGIEEQVIE